MTRRQRRIPELSLGTRIFLVAAGWLLVLAGFVQLFIPGQGLLTILLGVTLLSLVSERIHALLRHAFSRWPRGWRRVQKLRRRIHDWLAHDEAPTEPTSGEE